MSDKQNLTESKPQCIINPEGKKLPLPIPNKIADKDVIIKTKLVFDPETGTTSIDESESIDLVELIQTYRDQCGMEYVQKLIKMGYATPDKFADDGKHGGDATGTTDINEAYRDSLVAESSTRQIAKSLGMQVDENTTDQQIADRIKAIYDSIHQQQSQSQEVTK